MINDWKTFNGFGGVYQVNYEGKIRRIYGNGKIKILTPYLKKWTNGSKRLVVKLTYGGIPKEVMVHQIVANAYLGNCPNGYVPYHINGLTTDNYASNIAYISRADLGKLTGANPHRKGVAKISSEGEIVEVYSSARECARNNYMSYQTVIDRCNGKCKSAFAPDGFAYAWEDSEVSVRNAIRKIEKSSPLPTIKALDVEMEW
jgi:hypothetical protein